ncbi:hypothetical protein ACOSQ2_019230 [Xanthoceras sorbifolium]
MRGPWVTGCLLGGTPYLRGAVFLWWGLVSFFDSSNFPFQCPEGQFLCGCSPFLACFVMFSSMSSPSDRGRHKAGFRGPSSEEGRKLRSLNKELPASPRVRSNQREFAEVSSSGDHGGSEGAYLVIREGDNPSLVAPEVLDAETEGLSFPFSKVTRETLVELVHNFHPPKGINC